MNLEKFQKKLAETKSESILLAVFSVLVAHADNALMKAILRDFKARGIAGECLHEVIIQSYLFCGFPRMLDALFNLTEEFAPQEYLGDRNSQVNLGYSAEESRQFERDGLALIQRIYAERFPKLRDSIQSMSPDIYRIMIMEGYGKILSRPGLDVLTRELCVVATLAYEGRYRQLRAHLLGSLNVGVGVEDLMELLDIIEPFTNSDRIAFARVAIGDITG